ncbi:MAG TPA: sigma-70 family RNA polymerase sigma factor [Abditibacteriaceae bacterium]|jgi:RNA polymerase sigma-70 factor (ECF subfamily)
MPWKWNKSAVHSMSTPLCPGIAHNETSSHSHAPTRASQEDRTHAALDANQLQQLYLSDVLRYVRRRVDNAEEAEDITAEVFATAFEALPKFRHECHPRIWLLRIAHRSVLMWARRRKTRGHVLHDCGTVTDDIHDANAATHGGTVESPEVLIERAEAQRVLGALMGALKAEQCEALRLQYWEGLSINEIAVVMKRSPAAVNSLLQRARKTLFERGKDYFLTDEVTR